MSARPPVVLDSVGGRFAMWAGNATRVELCVFDDVGLQRQIDLDPSDDGWFTGHLHDCRQEPRTVSRNRCNRYRHPAVGKTRNHSGLDVRS